MKSLKQETSLLCGEVVHSFTMELSSMHKKTAFICAAWNSSQGTMDAVKMHYEALVDYMHFQDVGSILATGCGTPSMTLRSPFMEKHTS